MANLIDKDALVAEIEKKISSCYLPTEYTAGRKYGLGEALKIIDTQEVREVDLDKEIEKYLRTFSSSPDNGIEYSKKLAKHFFELGLNTSNPLTWEDIKTIQNISREVYAEVAKGKDDFYLIYPTEQSFLEEVVKRFKAQKGEEYDRQSKTL